MAAAVEKAYGAIRDGILSRAYPPGTRLKEERLAAEIGVSRTPVREALRRLHIEGWIEFAPNQGAIVPAWTERDIEEIFAIRALLESYGAEMAARHATEAQIAEMQAICAALEAEVAGRKTGFLDRVGDLNRRFHRLVAEASGGIRLAPMVNQAIEMPLVMDTFQKFTEAELQRSATHHREVVQAIAARDPGLARSVMHAHILSGRSKQREAPAEPALSVVATGGDGGRKSA
jgi:DNA-binding GntR family transcriptional regulator